LNLDKGLKPLVPELNCVTSNFIKANTLKAEFMGSQFSDQTIDKVLKTIIKLLRLNYLFPDQVESLTDELEAIYQQGHYQNIKEAAIFAEILTGELFRLTGDGHLAVDYNPAFAASLKQYQNAESKEDAALLPLDHGFKTVRYLTGNVGYLELSNFASAAVAGKTAAAAFELLSDCAALLIDLRQNYGGEVSMVQMLASYLFDQQPYLLHTYLDPRVEDQQQIWTFPFVPGKRLPDVPVYILVSQNTYSAAEEFAYDLQAMGRVIVVGERTGGGAHLTETHVAGSDFVVQIPVARVINPITGTNWQGQGIEPDISTPALEALPYAHLHALEMLANKVESDAVRSKWDIEVTIASYYPVSVPHERLLLYMGQYGSWSVHLVGTQLYLDFQHTRTSLLSLSEVEFSAGEGMRIQFLLRDDQVTGAVIRYRNRPNTLTLSRIDASKA
jgi:retinol-binding protein 3